MQSITNAANAASNAVWGDSSNQSGREPVSGQTGSGTASEPYDAGNTMNDSRLSGLPGDDARPAFSTGRDVDERGNREDGAYGGSTYGSDNPYTGAGAHQTPIAEKLDPRGDRETSGIPGRSTTGSDYNSFPAGQSGTTDNYGTAGSYGTTGQYGTSGEYGNNPQSTSEGPHSSNIAGRFAPTVGSDSTGSGNYGSTGGYGNNLQSTSQGPHSSNIAGRFAPTVGSDSTGSGSYGTTADYGNISQSTSEGPHSSSIAGRFAPTVGSDRDGSSDYGTTGSYDNNSQSISEDRSATNMGYDRDGSSTMGSNTAADTSSSSRMSGSDSTSTRVAGQDDTSTGPTGGRAQGANVTGNQSRPEHETDKTGVTSMHSNDPKFSDQRQTEAGASSVDSRGQSRGPTGGFGAAEPSVSADPSSAQKPMQKQQGADRPNEEPSGEQAGAVKDEKQATENAQAGNDTGSEKKEPKKDPNDHSGEPLGTVDHSGGEKKSAGQEGGDPHGEDKGNKGTGEKWVKTSGMAADGGDFDATKPGAGKEAERLLEEKGIHREPGPGKPATDPNAPDPLDPSNKPGMGQKIKEKLHLGSH